MQKSPFLLTRGHDFVEICGTKWATCNIGAEKPTDYGLYFQWGDTQGYTAEQVRNGEKRFSWEDYRHISNQMVIKYNLTDNKMVLELSDDAVHFNWGGAWRMPTREEFETLYKAVDTAWTENYQGSGVAGLVCIAKTDSSKELFFPATGCCYEGEAGDVGHSGFYWSNIGNDTHMGAAYGMGFSRYGPFFDCHYARNNGLSVRGVC